MSQVFLDRKGQVIEVITEGKDYEKCGYKNGDKIETIRKYFTRKGRPGEFLGITFLTLKGQKVLSWVCRLDRRYPTVSLFKKHYFRKREVAD